MPNPILKDFPDSIETERLVIRAPRPGDGKALNRSIRESQAHLREWMAWAVNPFDVEGQEAWVRENAAEFTKRKTMPMVIVLKETGKLIGGTGYHNLDWDVPSLEIGYWLHTAYTGRGLMTEAVNALTDFAFDTLDMERIEIQCMDKNRPSAAVAERAGYTLDAVLKNNRRHHITNELEDTRIYSKIKQDVVN